MCIEEEWKMCTHIQCCVLLFRVHTRIYILRWSCKQICTFVTYRYSVFTFFLTQYAIDLEPTLAYSHWVNLIFIQFYVTLALACCFLLFTLESKEKEERINRMDRFLCFDLLSSTNTLKWRVCICIGMEWR